MKNSIHLSFIFVLIFTCNGLLLSQITKNPIKGAFGVELGKELNVPHTGHIVGEEDECYRIAAPKDKIGFNMIQVYVLPNTKIVHSIDATKYIGVKWENVDDLKQVLDEKYGRRNLQEMEYYGWTKCYSSWWDEESSTTIMISYEKRRIKLPAEYRNLTVRYEHTKLSDKVWQEKYKKEQEENKKRIDSIKGNF
jgi:hypothetical protein